MEHQGSTFPQWEEIVCGICWKSVIGHSLEELRRCAITSGRRIGETDAYLLPAHLRVYVGDIETQKQVFEATCPACGKRFLDHSREQIKACAAKSRPTQDS